MVSPEWLFSVLGHHVVPQRPSQPQNHMGTKHLVTGFMRMCGNGGLGVPCGAQAHPIIFCEPRSYSCISRSGSGAEYSSILNWSIHLIGIDWYYQYTCLGKHGCKKYAFVILTCPQLSIPWDKSPKPCITNAITMIWIRSQNQIKKKHGHTWFKYPNISFCRKQSGKDYKGLSMG